MDSAAETKIGYENEDASQVLSLIEKLITDAKIETDASPIHLSIGHQRYLDLDTKTKKNSTEEPPLRKLLRQLPVSTAKRVDFHFNFRITSDKEERRAQQAIQRLREYATRLAEQLQRAQSENDDREVSVDGVSKRIEEPMESVVSGCVSVIVGSEGINST